MDIIYGWYLPDNVAVVFFGRWAVHLVPRMEEPFDLQTRKILLHFLQTNVIPRRDGVELIKIYPQCVLNTSEKSRNLKYD